MRYLFLLMLTVFIPHHTYAENNSAFTAAVVRTAMHQSMPSDYPLITIDGPSVRMTVFTTYSGYKTSDKTLGATIWATVEPELQNLCKTQLAKNRKMSHEELSVWLVKLLGLPAKDATQRQFVIIDVPVIQAYYGSVPSQIGIFRPCTDPRISTHRDGSPACPKQMNVNDTYIASEYKTWFINNSIASYTFDNGMPWTEYGYTYNWNRNAEAVYSASEFVILKNTPITVLNNPKDPATVYMTPEQYCGAA